MEANELPRSRAVSSHVSVIGRGDNDGSDHAVDELKETDDHVELDRASEPCQIMGRRPSMNSSVSIRSVLSEHHGTKLCSCRDVLAVLIVLGIVGLAVWLLSSQSEKLVAFSEFVEDTGPFGHLIFFAIFMFVGLPCGYNWSTLVLLVAFAYGWAAVVDANIGTGISGIVNYHGSRIFFGKCAQRRIRALGPKKRLYLQAAKHVIERHRAGFLMLLLLRMQPVFPFGMANAFLGALCRLGPMKYLSSTLLGSQVDMLKLISIAVMVRGAGSLEAATQGEAGTRSLIVTACLSTFVIIGSAVFARYLAVRVLPSLISEDECMDADSECLDSEQPVGCDGPTTFQKEAHATGSKENDEKLNYPVNGRVEATTKISHDERRFSL